MPADRRPVCVVTGGAQGIGAAIVESLTDAGADVAVIDVQGPPEASRPSSDDDNARRGRVRWLHGDLRDPESTLQAIGTAAKWQGRLDVLVNNAATSTGHGLIDTDDEEFLDVLRTNVGAAAILARRAVEIMLAQQPDSAGIRGRIVNIGSQHGMVAARQDFAYGVSKAALMQMTRQIAVEFAPNGVTCNTVAPGKIFTGVGERESDPQWLDWWESRTPAARHGVPSDVAGIVRFLAFDAPAFVTGSTMLVDGGWSAS